ncbi:hypothetical protein COLO4_05698 [Corchorus olitorius]|uniref:Uncharacterized protein n=1 Tax=Corchorus olitorius TaxID=93759 RepID=A0A1R3KQ57_9ROSI|nr:hypothetical protein COLO4_05698 [Corchorus olitorius]
MAEGGRDLRRDLAKTAALVGSVPEMKKPGQSLTYNYFGHIGLKGPKLQQIRLRGNQLRNGVLKYDLALARAN